MSKNNPRYPAHRNDCMCGDCAPGESMGPVILEPQGTDDTVRDEDVDNLFSDELKVWVEEAANIPQSAIDAILKERGARYGDFEQQFTFAQNIKGLLSSKKGWDKLSPAQKETLEMIATKISRILNGDPKYPDNWDDIAGYAKLVGDRLRGDVK